MTNKFTKSVLERQAKEQKLATTAARPVKTEPTASQTVSVPTPEPELQPSTPVAEKPRRRSEKSAKEPTANIPNLDAFIVREPSRTAKNKTFYLDAAVIEAVRRAAAAQKVTDSKLVNDILKKILGV